MNNIENIYTGYYDNVELTEEDIEHLITEDLDEYIRLAPIHNGKKIVSEKAWDALYDKELGEYDSKNSYSSEEHSIFMKKLVEFSNKYECRY